MPAIVIDSNLILYTLIDSPYSEQATRAWSTWQASGAAIVAPALWHYEITSVIHRLMHLGELTDLEAREALETALSFEVQTIEADELLCKQAFIWATRLATAPAYDGFYLAVTEQLNAEFWTGDKRLVNNARGLGIRWAHRIGELGVVG